MERRSEVASVPSPDVTVSPGKHPMSTAAQGRQTVAGIERALDVLALFGESTTRNLGVTEIAQELGLSKAVVHRILASFRAKGFVDLDETTRRSSLGPKILFLGLDYLDGLDVLEVLREVMAPLSGATHETVAFSLRSHDTRVFVDQVTPAREVRMQVPLGRPCPLHVGASSKAFLAFLPQDEVDAYLGSGRLERVTSRTVVDPRRLRRDLASIREAGYASSHGERAEGAAAVAAPVFGRSGSLEGVLSVCGPSDRFRDSAERAAELLLDHAARASARLGHRGS